MEEEMNYLSDTIDYFEKELNPAFEKDLRMFENILEYITEKELS